MTLQFALVVTGIVLVLVGVVLFVKKPGGSGGKTRIKLPGVEAELPVASLLPMVLGVVLLLGAGNVQGDPAANTPSVEPEKPHPGTTPTAPTHPSPPAQSSCVNAASVSLAMFKWAPGDCPDKEGAPVRIDDCAERRPLSWLRAALEKLRDARLEGFGDLPASFDLKAADAYGKKDLALHVMSGGQHVYNVGVGYNVKSGAKDGCLSLTQNGKLLSPSVCMDKSGEWWERRAQQLCAVSAR